MKKLICILVVLSVLLTSISSIGVNAAQSTVSNPIIDSSKNISKFDVITFGNFWQSDYKKKEPIRWIVLKVEGDGIKLIAEKNLCPIHTVYAYSNEDTDIEHIGDSEKSLYKEINDKFFDLAFSKAEKDDIKETKKDKNVLLPTENEISQTYFGQSLKTNYCDSEEVICESLYTSNWQAGVMDMGGYDEHHDYVEFDGHVLYNVKTGVWYDLSDPAIIRGLRPVIFIRKSSSLYKKVGVVGKQLQYFSPKATKISKIKAKKKTLKIKWSKKGKTDGVMGYKLQYSTSKKFKKAKTVTIKKANSKTKTIKNLKSKKKYYVRVQTYSVIAGKTYTSKWSKVKSKKTK